MAQIKVRQGAQWVVPKDIKRFDGVQWITNQNPKVRVGVEWKDTMSYYTLRLFGTNWDGEWLLERDPDTGTLLHYVNSPSATPIDMGGIKNRLYHFDAQGDKVYEVDPDTLAVTLMIDYPSPGADWKGMGGMDSRLFLGSYSDNMYEVDPDTMVTLNSTNSLSGGYLYGVGGTSSKLFRSYHSSSYDRYYELDPDTFATLNYASVSGIIDAAYGIGGGRQRLFASLRTAGFCEMDPDTFLVIGDAKGGTTHGIGGMK